MQSIKPSYKKYKLNAAGCGLSGFPDYIIEIQDTMIPCDRGLWLVKFFKFGKKPRARKFSWILLREYTARFQTELDAIEYARTWAKRNGWVNHQPASQLTKES
jgi:hypothetical protein